jgi:hypothetical protein
MGHTSSRHSTVVDAVGRKKPIHISTTTSILSFNCGCDERTFPDDRQYHYFDMKSSAVIQGPDISSVHFSSPPYIASSYREESYDRDNVVQESSSIKQDSNNEQCIDNLHTLVDRKPDILNSKSPIALHNENIDDSESCSADRISPRTLFNNHEIADCHSNSLSFDSGQKDEDHDDGDEDDDDSDLLNPHPTQIFENNRQLCNNCISTPIFTDPTSGYFNAGCLSLTNMKKESLLRSCSAHTPPTLASTGSNSSFDSSVFTMEEETPDILPSFQVGKPISLHVSETFSSVNANESSDGAFGHECFSYDPFFNFGRYSISTQNGGPYGNGLHVNMCGPFMHLQDSDNRVWAVMRSRCTFFPSFVLYALIPRYQGQISSSHCLTNSSQQSSSSETDVSLFPWVLIKKDGRRLDHDVTVHMAVDGEASILLDGQYESLPRYVSRSIVDPKGNHSHSIVHTVLPEGSSKPCCSFVRQSNDRASFDVTIAPGIDPLLMLCVLAVQCKMALEPKLNS